MTAAHTTAALAAAATTEAVAHYLIELAGDLYAIPQSSGLALSWVQRPQDPTYLPTLPPWCLGLVNERDTSVLLVDLRAVLGLPPALDTEPRENARHIFVECDGDTIGFLVDRTHRFCLLQPPPSVSGDDFILGAARAGG